MRKRNASAALASVRSQTKGGAKRSQAAVTVPTYLQAVSSRQPGVARDS